MAAYLGYVQVLKSVFMMFELVHVPREQNARADLLAKLASSGKGGRQRTVIQETLKTPRTFVADNMVGIHQISTFRGRVRSHRSLTQETLRTPSVSVYPVPLGEGDPMQVCTIEEGDMWMTPREGVATSFGMPTPRAWAPSTNSRPQPIKSSFASEQR